MQQLEGVYENIAQHLAGRLLFRRIFAIEAGLGHFNIPVAVFAPDEVIDLLGSQTQLKLLHVIAHVPDYLLQPADDPLIRNIKMLGLQAAREILGQIHGHKPGSVPDLVGKVSGGVDLLVVVAHVVSRAHPYRQAEPQGVRTIFLDDLQRIDAIV